MSRAALLACCCVAACATAPARRPADPFAPALPRSSLAAVLQARAELELTPEQLDALGELDEQREQAANRLREAEQERASGQAPPPGSRPPTGRSGSARGANGGPGGSGIPHRGAMSDDPPALDSRLDDLDRQYYLQAEALLTDAQRPRAREVATRYREQLFDQRARR